MNLQSFDLCVSSRCSCNQSTAYIFYIHNFNHVHGAISKNRIQTTTNVWFNLTAVKLSIENCFAILNSTGCSHFEKNKENFAYELTQIQTLSPEPAQYLTITLFTFYIFSLAIIIKFGLCYIPIVSFLKFIIIFIINRRNKRLC